MNKYFKTFLLFLILLITVNPHSFGQSGEELFKSKCSPCHTVGGGKLLGPDLKGITEKRKPEWLLSFIKSSTKFISSGNTDALAVFNEFSKMPMPDQNLSDTEIKSILYFIGKKDATAQNDIPQIPVAEFIAKATPENIQNGTYLFTGKVKMKNGGMTCVSCHSISDKNVENGGTFAKDLSLTYNNMKAEGIKGIILSPPFPAMTNAYQNNPLTEQEIFDLTSFIKNAGTQPSTPMYGFLDSKFLMYSILLFAVMIALVGYLWNIGKNKSTNKEILERQKITF